MNILRSRIQLLSLISIFFIYKAIDAGIRDNINEVALWVLITVIYIISLLILYFVMKKSQKHQNI